MVHVSKPLLVGILLLAASASAALVFFAMSALSGEEPAPAPIAAEPPSESTPVEEPAPTPHEAALIVRTDITDASLFVDAFDRGPIEAESRRMLPLGPHRIEARRGATVIAALTVELSASGADVELHADGTTTQTARPEPPRGAARARSTSSSAREDRPAPREEPPGLALVEVAPTASSPTASSRTASSPTPAATPTPDLAAPPPRTIPALTVPMSAATLLAQLEVRDPRYAPIVVPATPAPATPAPTPTRPASAVASATPPTEAQMRAALDSVLAEVRTCAGDFHGELDVSATFLPDGSVRARIGRLPTREARYCVQRQIQESVRLRSFEGRAIGYRHTYRL